MSDVPKVEFNAAPEGKPSLPPEKKSIFRRMFSALRGTGLAGHSEGSGRTIDVRSPVPRAEKPFFSGAADLVAMSLAMVQSDAVLLERRGELVIKRRPRFFSIHPKTSPKAARLFLSHLKASGRIQDQEQALKNFSSSKWFQRTLRQDPSLAKDLAETNSVIEREKAAAGLVFRSADIQREIEEDGVPPLMASKVVHDWKLGKTAEYLSPKTEFLHPETNERVRKMIRITPQGGVEKLFCFEPIEDDEPGRKKFLEHHPLYDVCNRPEVREYSSRRPLPEELSYERAGEALYCVPLAGSQTVQLVGGRSSGTLQEFVSSPKVKMAEKLRAALGVVRGLRFLHARRLTNLVSPAHIEVVDGVGKIARGNFSRIEALAGDEIFRDVSGRAPESYAEPIVIAKWFKDMFSFGALLLAIADPDGLGRRLKEAGQAGTGQTDDEARMAYVNTIAEIRTELKKRAEPKLAGLYALIADLINPLDGGRPNSTQAEKRLQAVVDHWEEG